MSTQPYNELGQILAEGGEIALATAILNGWSDERIAVLFQRRFEPITDSDRAALWRLSEDMVSAGRYLRDLPLDAPIDKANIPVNSRLGDEDEMGAAEYYKGRVRVPGTEQWYDIGVFTGRADSLSDIVDEILRQAQEYMDISPEGFGRMLGGDANNLDVSIDLSERKY